MLRRRRPLKNGAIHFSFDSFLDLVTNVVGIIIRLILVTWVGARSYHASMQWIEPQAPAEAQQSETEVVKELPPPKLSDDPLYSEIEQARREIEQAKARLTAQIKDLELVQTKAQQAQQQLFTYAKHRTSLEQQRNQLAGQSQTGSPIQPASYTVDEVRQRSKKLLDDIKALEALPSSKKQLRYHAPVSRAVHSDEVCFECQNGRLSFIDLTAFLLEWEKGKESPELREELKRQWKVERVTAQVGAFRLRFVVERVRTMLDAEGTPTSSAFSYGLSAWVVEPLTADRGETLERALAPKSEFRQIVDPLDGNISTVTIWVYPDSFEMFRQIRDYLYERGLNVAGRPLPLGMPIAASKHGSASRGQ